MSLALGISMEHKNRIALIRSLLVPERCKGTRRDPVRIVANVPKGADEGASNINVQVFLYREGACWVSAENNSHSLFIYPMYRWSSDYIASRRRVVDEAQPRAAAFECAQASSDGGSTALPTSRLYKVHVPPLFFVPTKDPGGLRQRSKGESACEGV
ncbi:unnamed protein product [Nippostrongylus brasiliensis]|uniref:Uncharacterized protein n=1 Tax=Nippostrongylus brasiliensis TaxID=27835 RepID=A0A0N4YLM6_NIPBR|nr:unnamed protein product [Nippostrongylus brasiliensis]